VKPVLGPDYGDSLCPGGLGQGTSGLNGSAHVADINAMSPVSTFGMEKIFLRVDHDQRTGTKLKVPSHGGKVNRI
jgi:hypothetical protein